jgi:hypothetical protein
MSTSTLSPVLWKALRFGFEQLSASTARVRSLAVLQPFA